MFVALPLLLLLLLLLLLSPDEDLYSYTLNLNGVLKVLLLKISVGLITIQGIVVELMNQFGANPYEGNDQFSAEDRLQRNYCE